MASLIRRRGDLSPETQNFEEEQSDPVRTFAQLRRLGVGLVTVSHANFVGLIRIPRPFTHPLNATGERFLTHLFGSFQGAHGRREGDYASGSNFGDNDGHVVASATSNGSIDQRVDDRGHILASGQGVPDVIVGQFVEKAVAAHDDSIPFFNGKSRVLDLEGRSDPECPGEDSIVGVLSCLVLS